MLEDVGPSLLVVARHCLDELAELIDDGRHDQRGDDRDDERHRRDDGEGGDPAIDAEAPHALHKRLEQIGKHEARDERQKDLVKDEQPDQRQREEQHPKGGVGGKADRAVVHDGEGLLGRRTGRKRRVRCLVSRPPQCHSDCAGGDKVGIAPR